MCCYYTTHARSTGINSGNTQPWRWHVYKLVPTLLLRGRPLMIWRALLNTVMVDFSLSAVPCINYLSFECITQCFPFTGFDFQDWPQFFSFHLLCKKIFLFASVMIVLVFLGVREVIRYFVSLLPKPPTQIINGSPIWRPLKTVETFYKTFFNNLLCNDTSIHGQGQQSRFKSLPKKI